MNTQQFEDRLKFVFDELQASGLPIRSEVFVVLTKLFTEYKLVSTVRDQAIDNAVFYYDKNRELKEEIIKLASLIQLLHQRNENI